MAQNRHPFTLSPSKGEKAQSAVRASTRSARTDHPSAWKLIMDPPSDPFTNMARDEELAGRVRRTLSAAILRIYQWNQPAISLGRRQTSGDLPPELLTRNLPIVQRPTGGGAVVHTLEEVTYSLSASRTDLPARLPIKEVPILFHRHLKEVLMEEGFILSSVHPEQAVHPSTQLRANGASKEECRHLSLCFASPVCGDLLFRGHKVAGSALRAWKDGILIQGSFQRLPVSYNKLVEAVLLATRRLFKPDEETDLTEVHSCRR